MDNYGNDYFMSQEGYASIDFTLLDRPNSTIASAPESTAALLPDLHVADSSFSSFDFLDGPSVDAFGGVLRDADEVHSRDQEGYRSDFHKYKKDRSVLQNSMALPRGDGDADSELPSPEFHVPFEVQKPVSNLDFFSQGGTKEPGHPEQQAQDPGHDAADGNHDYFEQGQISQQAHSGAGGAGGWYNTWAGSSTQGDQTQVFFQTPSYDEASDERRMMQMKGSTSQLAGQVDYHSLSSSAQVPNNDPTPKATHSFLPTTKQSDTRQASNMGLGLPSAQVNATPSTVVRSSPRNQAFDYEGLMNGSSVTQFRQSSSGAVENTASARRHPTSDANLGGHNTLRSHAQSQTYKYSGQNLGSMGPVEVSPLKVNDYDFLGGQYVLKGQTQGEIGQQLAVEEMQAWHQHPLLSHSNQQQASYQQPYHELSRHHQQSVDQQSQQSRQQQLQQFVAVNHQNQSLGNQLSAFLSESPLQDLPRVVQPDRQNSQLAVESPRALLQANYQPINNLTNLNWSSSDPSSMEGLAHDYLMGADQNFNWQALALKASQVDPALYGTLPVVNRRDTTGQPLSTYSGIQGGLQEYYAGAGKLATASSQVGKPIARTLASGGSGGSVYGGDYQAEVYESAASLQPNAQASKHQALGKMPFWQNPYSQSVEHNRSSNNLTQTNLPPRIPQVPANSQARQQRNWSGISGQQDTLQGGLFSQSLVNAEALKHSLLAGSSIQQSGQQTANARQSARTQNIEAAHYFQQNSSQAASGSQFLNALGTKQQSNWSRQNLQQNVPQTSVAVETSSSLESHQKTSWTNLNIQQASSDSQSLSSLKQNIWSGHNAQQSSRPAANSLHLFTDLDGRRSSMQNSHDLQQGSAQPAGTQQVGKVDVNLQSSRSILSGSLQGSEKPSTLLDLDTSRQSGWRDHSLLQGTTQTSNSLQAYQDLDKNSSWRNIWQASPSAAGPSQLLQMDDARHQRTLWGHNLQKGSSHAVESQVAAINTREQSGWSTRDVQQESPQTNQLLSSLGAQQGSHHTHSLDGRHHSGQFHLLQEDHARSENSAEGDGRQKASHQNAYNLQSHVGMTQTDIRHKASQNSYSLQSQVAAETDSRHKSCPSVYNFQSQLATAESDARQKASENTYSLQSQVGSGETDVRHKASHNAYSLQSHLGTADTDTLQRGNQNVYSLQTQVATVEKDAHSTGSQNAYNLQSQVAATETDARIKGGHSAFSLHAHLGAYSQQNNMDGRQARPQWPHTSQQGSSQSGTSMYTFPSMAIKDHNTQNSLNVHAWNSAVNNVERWQKSGAGNSGQFHQVDISQVENVDARQQSVQSGSNSQHSSPQNESHLQSSGILRPPSRLGRLNSSQDTPLSGVIGTTSAKPAALNHRQTHGSNVSSTSPPQSEILPSWSQGQPFPARGDTEKFSLGGESNSGTSKVLPAWTCEQNLSAQQDTDQINLGVESSSVPNEVLHTWSHGQNLSTRKDAEQLNLGGESKSGASDVQPTWSRGQNISVLKDVEQLNLAAESSSGMDEVTSTWSRRQNVSAQTEVDQLKLGRESSNGRTEDVLPAWTRGQGTSICKDLEKLNCGGESNNGTRGLPMWSQGQTVSSQNVVDQLNLGEESKNGMNVVIPAWSRGQITPAPNDAEQFNPAGETNRVTDEAVPTWSHGRSVRGQNDEQKNLEGESNGGKSDFLPAWSRRQNLSSGKDAEHATQPGDFNSGINGSAKDALNPRPDAERRIQEEMSFLDDGTLRDSNIVASPAPSPDSNLFSPAAKQKSSLKVSSLSRNTLELLSRREELNESSSMNDEGDEEEELDPEESGANASSISLAHLRRNQASGPLSPQGFGLRLAPPSHLSQSSQAGNSSRLAGSSSNLGADASRVIPTETHKEQPQAALTSVSEQALMCKDDQSDPMVPGEIGTLTHSSVTTAIAASASYHYDSRQRAEETLPAEVVECSSAVSIQLNGSSSHLAAISSPNVNSGTIQPLPGGQHSGETGQPGGAGNKVTAPNIDAMIHRASDGSYGTNHSFDSSQSNAVGHLTRDASRKQYLPSNLAAQQSGTEQTAVLSKLLLTFKDSLAEQAMPTFAQQQPGVDKGSAERVNMGAFESFRTPGSKQVNGLQPAHWSMDPGQMSSVKADHIRRLAAQVQNRANQTSFGQFTTSSSNNIDKITSGSRAFLGPTTAAGHYISGDPTLPGKAMASGQSHSEQVLSQGPARPGQEISSVLSHSGKIYDEGYMLAGQGITTDIAHLGQPYTQSRTLAGQEMMSEQSQPVQGYTSSGQGILPGQSYPGQAYAESQALPGQSNPSGQSYPGQTYNPNQGLSSLASTSSLPHSGQAYAQGPGLSGQSVSPGCDLSGPETPGQLVSGQVTVTPNKQNKGRQQRRGAQKAEGTDTNYNKMQGRVISQQSAEFAPQQPTGYLPQRSSVFQSQQALQAQKSQHFQYGQLGQQNEVPMSIQASQDDIPSASEARAASILPTEGLESKDTSAGISKGLEVMQKPNTMVDSLEGRTNMQVPPVRSSFEQYGVQPENQGNLLQQWQNTQSLSPFPGLSDYQFQRILEARPSIAAALDAYKGDPHIYQLAAAQLRASLGQIHMPRQLGQYQQQARGQSALSVSTSVANSSSGNSAPAQAAQAAHFQSSQASQFQLSQASQATHSAQAVQNAQAAQAAQAAQTGQSGQPVHQDSQAVQAAQAAIISKNAHTAARLQYLSQMVQRGHNANGLSPWFSGVVAMSGSNASPFTSRMAEGKGPDSATVSPPLAASMGRSGTDDVFGNRFLQNSLMTTPPIKKRKEYPSLVPWHEAISQSGGYVSSISGSELEWAAATNRIPDTDLYDEVVDQTDTRAVVLSRAKRRLRLTTHLMQQITPAVPATFMQSNSHEDRECATFTFSKLTLAEACRIASIARRIRDVAAARDAEESRIEKERELAMKEAKLNGEDVPGTSLPLPANIADRFKLRMKDLENDLQRLETSPSAVDLVRDMQDTERISLVNRLAVHHGALYSLQNSDSPHRAVPEKYVTTVQMPSTLPEGLMCVSL